MKTYGQEVADYTRDRSRTDIDTLRRLYPEIRARAFAVQGVDDFNKLSRIQEAVAKLGEGGDWNKLKGQIADEMGGDKAAVKQHAETVLRTNGFQAFAAARYRRQQASKAVFPFLKYVSMDDGRVRETHAKLDGVILPADDPFWKDHYPPWDYNCRCMVIQLTKEDADDEVAAGEGQMWNEATRQDFMAQNRGKDATRDFHFRPDSLELDLRDIAKAKGRTPEMMEDFGKLMETRKIGTGEFEANGTEKTISVRDWMWKPVQKEYQEKARSGSGDSAFVLDAFTGREISKETGSVDLATIPANTTQKAILVNRTSGSAVPTPDDVLTSLRADIDSVEIINATTWMRIRAIDKGATLRSKLKEFADALATARGDSAETSRILGDWRRWISDQKRAGLLQVLEGGVEVASR